MKRRSLIIVFFVFVLIGTIIYYRDTYHSYKSGENDNFKIKVGETFRIKLHENGSTGYSNCWLNEHESKSVKMIKKDYEKSLQSKLGYIGSGGTIILTFEGIALGHEVIKLADCPVARERKNCSDYTMENTKSDNEFMVDVVE